MKFAPKSADEVNAIGLLKPGVYDFCVQSAEEKESASGNEMIVVDLAIEDADGDISVVRDYLVAIDSMAYKTRHFAETTGLLSVYEQGDMPASLVKGAVGRCKIAIEPAKGEYRAKNKVVDYVAPLSGEAKAAVQKQIDDFDTDLIPF
jgi:hypothetical protein